MTSHRRPVIGISCYVELATRGSWVDVPSALLPYAYVEKVERAGGVALLIPPRPDADDAMAAEILERLDGLVIAGGADVEPRRYGARRHPFVQAPRPDRDSLELALARASRPSGTPLLGICRGMQVMAVAEGGTLVQHLPDVLGNDSHAPVVAGYGRHEVHLVPGTRIAEILGADLDVPTHHHQAVATFAGLEPAAWAADRTLEALEDRSGSFRLGVQWHPEVSDDPRLFEALVAAAAAH
jgi:putative glutamine amidotransferase